MTTLLVGGSDLKRLQDWYKLAPWLTVSGFKFISAEWNRSLGVNIKSLYPRRKVISLYRKAKGLIALRDSIWAKSFLFLTLLGVLPQKTIVIV